MTKSCEFGQVERAKDQQGGKINWPKLRETLRNQAMLAKRASHVSKSRIVD